MTGRVFAIESFATLDGGGIRCALFFSGCNLRCKCCHNVDSWSGAGEEYAPDQLARKVLRYKPYFKNCGGVTFSGGEPLLQAAFLVELSRLLKAEGVDLALDTSGSLWNGDAAALLDLVDLVILDLKCPTEVRYAEFAGGSLADALRFAEEVGARGKRLWLRTVIVPGVNDSFGDVDAYAALARTLDFERYELLGFHTMGFSKFEAAGLKNPLADTPALSPERLLELQSRLDGRLQG